MHEQYRTVPIFCFVTQQYRYLRLSFAAVNTCNSHLQTVYVSFLFILPTLPPASFKHRWTGEGNENYNSQYFFMTSILYEIISRNTDEYQRPNCSSCTRETQSMMVRSIFIYFHSRESNVSKASYTLPGYTKKTHKNNQVISYLSYTQSVSLAFQFCLVFATRLSKLDTGVTWLLGVIKTY